jgi:hypothetical protein
VKVYVLSEADYDGAEVIAVFADKAEAEAEAARLNAAVAPRETVMFVVTEAEFHGQKTSGQ